MPRESSAKRRPNSGEVLWKNKARTRDREIEGAREQVKRNKTFAGIEMTSPAAGTLPTGDDESARVALVALDGKSFPCDLRFHGFCFRGKASTYLGDP